MGDGGAAGMASSVAVAWRPPGLPRARPRLRLGQPSRGGCADGVLRADRRQALIGRPAQDGEQGQAAGDGPEPLQPVPARGLGGDPGLDRPGDRLLEARAHPVGSGRWDRLAAPHQLVHPGLRLGGDLNLLPEQAEDLMDARDFREVDVGGEALLLVLRDLIGLQVVIHVAGDEIGIGGIGARLAGHRVPPLPRHAVDPVDELTGEGASRDLLADLPDFRGRERVVEPGEKGPESQTHPVLLQSCEIIDVGREGGVRRCGEPFSYMGAFSRKESVRFFFERS